jgi:hypothetical protein
VGVTLKEGNAEYDALVAWLWDQLDKHAGPIIRERVLGPNGGRKLATLREQSLLVFGSQHLSTIESLMIGSFTLGLRVKGLD